MSPSALQARSGGADDRRPVAWVSGNQPAA